VSTSGGVAKPAGGKAPNACGIFDMSGNVWEWTHDWYSDAYYTDAGRTDPVGPGSGRYRVFRGGSFENSAGYSRVAFRTADGDVARWPVLGMRLARTAP
jgi:formylglycine-generating enzyme required for sulfatase activity